MPPLVLVLDLDLDRPAPCKVQVQVQVQVEVLKPGSGLCLLGVISFDEQSFRLNATYLGRFFRFFE